MSVDGKGHLYKRCAYSDFATTYGDTRIPAGEKTPHTVYEGRMVAAARGSVVGWECQDDDCSYYLGTAVTEISKVRYNCNTNTLITGTLSIQQGVRFFEP